MTDASRLQLQYKPIAWFKPYAKNSRTHTHEQVVKIAASMSNFGWTNPVLCRPDGSIIAGHARLDAGKSLGITEIPCIELTVTDDQARALVIADNRLALDAGWDFDVLASELELLKEADVDLLTTGFDSDELDEILGMGKEDGLTDPDAAPALAEHAVSQTGDVWILGPHRLVCGSCTIAGHVESAFGGARPNLMVTDPPYGVDYKPHWRVEAGVNKPTAAMGKVDNDDRADWREAWRLFPGSVAYVWHAGTKAHIVAESLEAVKLNVRAQIVWVKSRFALSRGHYHHQHEPLFGAEREGGEHEMGHYAVKDGDSAGWKGDRRQSTVWFIDTIKNDTGHSTQKPVECMERPIRNNSSPGMAVYEPFSGSGTTIIACQRTGRVCCALEINPLYVDVAVRRWQDYTGLQALLEARSEGQATALTFDQIVEMRKPAPSDPVIPTPETTHDG